MTAITQKTQLEQKKLDFLMEIDYLMEKMAHAHIPLDEGYSRLIELIDKGEKPENPYS